MLKEEQKGSNVHNMTVLSPFLYFLQIPVFFVFLYFPVFLVPVFSCIFGEIWILRTFVACRVEKYRLIKQTLMVINISF